MTDHTTLPSGRTVMGIDPGIRYLGTAVLMGEDLAYHSVLDLGSNRTDQILARVRRHLDRLLLAYQPAVVCVERTFLRPGRTDSRLRLVSDQIEACVLASGARLVLVAPTTLKKRVTGNGHASKDQVARAVCLRLPELKAYLSPERKWQARHHSNLFDAAALCLAAQGHESPQDR